MNTLRNLSFSISLLCALFAGAAQAQQSSSPAPNPNDAYAARVPGVVYVQFRAGYLPNWNGLHTGGVVGAEDPVVKIFREIGVTSITQFDPNAWKDSIDRRLGIDRIYDVYYSGNAAPLPVVVRLLQTGLIEKASPRYIFKPQWVPNDPYLVNQYWVKNVQAEAAWEISKGDSNVIIADVDEGVDVTHEDLKANIKLNPAGPGVAGWNTALNNDTVTPPPCDASICEGNHGTETTGCFGAVADNGLGVAGMAPYCKILVVRISDDNGQLTGAYEGIHYASTFCAQYAKRAVINNSWGGRTDAEALPFAEIFPQEITARGQVCVASAGNYALDNDVTPFYPACVPGVLSVGATDENDHPTSFTHYGHIVSVFAPGIDIVTTTTEQPVENNDGYTLDGVAGTSFSGPIVAGEVGLLMSKFPDLPPAAIQKRVISTCDPIPNENPYLYHGRVNAYNALNIPPSPSLAIQDYSVGSQFLGTLGAVNSTNNLNVNFINLGDADGNNLTATIEPGAGYTWNGYDPRYPGNWPTATIAVINKKDSVPGGFQIIRTGQYSEGSVLVSVAVNDATPPDTLSIRVALSPQPGMQHRVFVQHATCVKQLDAANGWAGFGVDIKYYDPERSMEDSILVSEVAVRGDTGWSLPMEISGGEPIYSMDAVDKDHAWFAGPTTVYATTDGTAPSAIAYPGVTIRSLHFSDVNNGMMIGDADGGKWDILQSNDGGNTWSPSPFEPPAGKATRSFYNAASWVGQHIWFGTDSGIFYSTNNGRNWVNAPLAGGTKKQRDVAAVTFAHDAVLGYAAVHPFADNAFNGQDADSAGLFVSNDGGITWQLYPHVPAGFIPYSIAFIPNTDTAIITSNDGIFKLASANGKDSITYISAPSSFDPRSSWVSVGGTSGAMTISAVSDASGIVDYSNGSDAVSEPDQPANALALTSWPNPATSSPALSFTLPREESVRITLSDPLGNTVTNVFDGTLAAGPHTLPVPTRNLTNGTYFCTLETASGERAVTNVVIAR